MTIEITEAWEKFFADMLAMKRELADVSDIVASQDKRIEKLERMIENG